MDALDRLSDAIFEALRLEPMHEVIAVLAGALATVITDAVERQGADLSQPILLEGGGKVNDITIHPLLKSTGE